MKMELNEDRKEFTFEYNNGVKVEIKPDGNDCVLKVYTDGGVIDAVIPSSYFSINVNRIMNGAVQPKKEFNAADDQIYTSDLKPAPKAEYKAVKGTFKKQYANKCADSGKDFEKENMASLEAMYKNLYPTYDYFQSKVFNKFYENYKSRFAYNWNGKADVYRLWENWKKTDVHARNYFKDA